MIGATQAIAPHNNPPAEPAIGGMQVTAPRSNQRAEAAIDGSTILNIAEVRLTGTGQPRTGLGVPRAVIRFPTVRQALVNSLAARAALLPATREVEPERATGPAAADLATAQVVAGSATGAVQEERIASETRISREAVVETGMPLAEVPGDTTERARETTAVVVPPACRPGEAEASVAVAEAEVEEGEGERHYVAGKCSRKHCYGYKNDLSESNSLWECFDCRRSGLCVSVCVGSRLSAAISGCKSFRSCRPKGSGGQEFRKSTTGCGFPDRRGGKV